MAKRIFLFSDGTGNTSAKLAKTNVWRLYEALDLGPARMGVPEQIAYYSNGVGTSSFRPLAMLGGIFGLGLKANVLDLYKYLCRNWSPHDEIYIFGFSRGSFTVRLLVGLIASQGILRDKTGSHAPFEGDLTWLARAAYREFARNAWPNRRPAKVVAKGVRAARDGLVWLHRKIMGRAKYETVHNDMTDIEFVGVWDTVAAYGGPIAEITRGIDDWIWPLTMPNYQLSPRVRKARHALALDDERDSFQPLLWDEVREEMLTIVGGNITETGGQHGQRTIDTKVVRIVPPGRLKQVWFAGMHADVGGGYSDESLSYVSLNWMIEQLGAAALLISENLTHIRKTANIFGPIHNSRAGLASYYRFQPRRIAAWIDPPPAAPLPQDFAETRPLRDPAIADAGYVLPGPPGAPPPLSPRAAVLEQRIRSDHGLLRKVVVHESVVSRIAAGTDGYAPLALPADFEIELATPASGQNFIANPVAHPILISTPAQRTAWEDGDARIWDSVWWRRLLYFAGLIPTLALAALPLYPEKWQHHLPYWATCSDARCLVQPGLALVRAVTGGYAAPWIDGYARFFWPAVLVTAFVGLMLYCGGQCERRLRGQSWWHWQRRLGLAPAAPGKDRGIATVRQRPAYAGFMRWSKWQALPAAAALVMIALPLWLALMLVLQTWLATQERHDICGIDAGGVPLADGRAARFTLDIANLCTVPIGMPGAAAGRPGRLLVAKGQGYSIRVTVIPAAGAGDGWYDRTIRGTPAEGHGAPHGWFANLTSALSRRVVRAGWIEPLIQIKAPRRGPGAWRDLAGYPVEIERLGLVCDPVSKGYVGSFTPKQDGNLAMFVNDAMLPLGTTDSGWVRLAPFGSLYANNHGSAIVQIWRGAQAPPPAVPHHALSCLIPADPTQATE